MKIVIYGQSKEIELVKSALGKDNEVVGYCNGAIKEQLGNMDYDYIVIAVENSFECKALIEELITDYAVLVDKIVDFFGGFYLQYVDRVMNNNQLTPAEGIVLGISHGQAGINVNYLSKPYYNLSQTHQDIYYNLKTLEYCMANYPQKMKNISEIIIDMYDYDYFNIDTSLTGNIINYYRWGGLNIDEHNYAKNRLFRKGVDDELGKLGLQRSPEKENRDRIAKLFPEFDAYSPFPENEYDQTRNAGLNEKQSPNGSSFRMLAKKYIKKRTHASTVTENEYLFKKILDTIYALNPKMKIYVVLIPRYISLERMEDLLAKSWKKEFEVTISKFMKDYPFQYLNLKGQRKLSRNKDFYFDDCHLSYKGSIAFTKMLNEKFKGLYE